MKKSTSLEFLGTVAVSANLRCFTAKKKFKLEKGGRICSYLGDNFTEWFLSSNGKKEDSRGKAILRYHKLKRLRLDGPIIVELGGEVKVETTLTEMFSLMAKQLNGKSGALLTNGWWNIFYIRDISNLLRAVFIGWCGGGWYVNARQLDCGGGWASDNQVFSRNSSES